MKLKHGGEKSTTRKGKKKRLKSERYRDRCDGGGYGRDKREKETLAS